MGEWYFNNGFESQVSCISNFYVINSDSRTSSGQTISLHRWQPYEKIDSKTLVSRVLSFAWVMANNFMESVYQVLLPSTGRNLRRAKQGEKWKETNVLQLEDQSSLKELKRESPADQTRDSSSDSRNDMSRKNKFLLVLAFAFTNEEKPIVFACWCNPSVSTAIWLFSKLSNCR